MKNIFLILLLSVFSVSVLAQGYQPGDKAIDFKLKNVDGKMLSMSDFKDAKGFVVIFTCNHCPYSIAWEDRINDLNRKYAKQGYPVIAINPNDPKEQPADSYENMIIRAKEKDFSFPYLFDEGQKVYPVYGATRTPQVYLLNKENGDLIVRYTGAIDDNYEDSGAVKTKYLEDAINALLNGKKIDNEFTKAIGCSIKKKK